MNTLKYNGIYVQSPAKEVECPFCTGDGIARCTNPDHGFIEAVPGDISRIGCPVCGHDYYNRIKNRNNKNGWEPCYHCNGTGKLTGLDAETVETIQYL